tara:strand:+ start:108 stop:554 length:447 start_codon:yes stop_codon:yes gene_type:complete
MENEKYHIVVVMSTFNETITDGLLNGATKAFNDNNGRDLTTIKVPGAFEIPATTKKVASKIKPDAIVTLGAVIKGETKHFDFISSECTRAIQNLTLEFDIPIMFGVLTTDNAEQAIQRSTTNNKGYEVMDAAFKMIEIFKDIELSSKK